MRTIAPGVSLARETYGEFVRHQSPWLAASIAYFTTFAIGPLIVVVVAIAGAALGSHRAVLAEVYGYVSANAGPQAARLVGSVVAATLSERRAGLMQAISWTIFVASAFGLCGSLQTALNTVWDVAPAKRTLLETLKARAIPFAMMLGIALALLLSVAIAGAIAAAHRALAHAFPAFSFAASVVDVAASYVLAAVLFALLYEFVPECRISWRHVWPGAFVSAFLFVAGQFVLARYLGRVAPASAFGAFGGLAAFLVWIYYSSQIVLIGAEFTRVYARHAEHGNVARAVPSAEPSR